MEKKKILIILASVVGAVVLTVSLLTAFVFVPMSKYSKAMGYYDNGDYALAKEVFTEIDHWKDSKQQLEIIAAQEHFASKNIQDGISAVCGVGGKVTVTYQLENDSADVTEELTAEKSTLNGTFSKVGYHFLNWELVEYSVDNTEDNYSASVTVKAVWSPDTDTKYIVNHYLENYENNEFTLAESVTLQGETDSTVTVEQKEFEGFVLPAIESVTIAPDGTSVVNYYYQRKIITLNFEANGGGSINPFETKWGTPLSDLPVSARDGYTFGGWFTNVDLTEQSERFTGDCLLYAYWTEEHKPAEFSYILGEGVYTLTGTTLTALEKQLPAYVGGNVLSAIGESALAGVTVDHLVIPDTVVAVGFGALKNANVNTLVLPFIGSSEEAVESGYLGYIFGANTYALNVECVPESLTKIVITRTLAIDDYALYGLSQIKNIVLPNSVTRIGNYAFVNTSIESLNIPDSVTNIGFGTLKYCDDLTSISLPFVGGALDSAEDGSNEHFGYIFGAAYSGENKDYVPVNLTVVEITNATEIDGYAFENCVNIEEIILPNTLLAIEGYAFKGCTGLRFIHIPASVEKMFNNVFDSCTNIVIYCEAVSEPSGWYSNWNAANMPVYYGVNGNTFTELNGLQYVVQDGVAVLSKCVSDAASIEIPATVTIGGTEYNVAVIGREAFAECSHLESVVLSNGVEKISAKAFYACDGLTNIVLPESIRDIGDYAFYNCTSLSEITLNDGLTAIGAAAFGDCPMEELFIPATVSYIGESAFVGCDDIVIYCEAAGASTTWNANWNSAERPVYYNVDDDAFVEINGIQYVIEKGYATVSNCVSDAAVITVASTVTIGDKTYTVTTIGSYAFENCDHLTSVSLPNTITTIEAYAFTDCDNLTSIVVPTSVISMGTRAFNNCSSLTIYCYSSQRDAQQNWGYGWYYGCRVSYNYQG